eukprot:TRINITY_DN7550_c0_g1_i1.p1 TRINITY_DN7550_c0_g1~~TRINITY_DN7550_c0_g1_i1.p1  ORF type:complete len:488 (-),score=85.57 TRINITY_DN7550_c0_g1_i1:404-1867(-)
MGNDEVQNSSNTTPAQTARPAKRLKSDKRVAALFCSDSTGHVNPMLGLASALIEAGWEVHFYIPKKAKELVEGVGATWRPMGEEELTIRGAAESVVENNLGLVIPSREINMLPFQVMPATLAVLPYLLVSVSKLQPRFVIYDACAPWGKVLAELLRIPGISCMTALPTPMAVRDSFWKDASADGWKVLSAVSSTLKAAYGISFNPNHSYMSYAPFTVVCAFRFWHKGEEDFDKTQFHYWGPLISKRQGSTAVPGCDSVKKLLSDKSIGRDGQKPLIFCSLGTVTTGPGFALFGSAVEDYYKKLLKAASSPELSHVAFVFAVGARAEVSEEKGDDGIMRIVSLFGETVPQNVVVARSIDQPKLLLRANVFLTHCGQNSTNEALLAAVPVVVAPFFGDQIDNARRFLELGCGLEASFHDDLSTASSFKPNLNRVTPKFLADTFSQILKESKFSTAMANVNEKLMAQTSQNTISEKILSIINYADSFSSK